MGKSITNPLLDVRRNRTKFWPIADINAEVTDAVTFSVVLSMSSETFFRF